MILAIPQPAYEKSQIDTTASQKIEEGISITSQRLLEAPKAPPGPAPKIPPILKKIAQCESHNRQFDEKGQVVRGIVNHADVGKYQINMTVWADTADILGYDLLTEEGNEAMALELYRTQGVAPWLASNACWEDQ